MSRRYVLIGCGPASIAAAEAIRKTDSAASITVVSPEPEGYYSRPGLAYLLAKEVPESSLFPFDPADIAALGVEMVHGLAARIDPGTRHVTLDDGRTLAYDRLLIATGSVATPLAVPGIELDGVVKLDDLADARDLIRRSHAARTAVVVGGGITALEIVEGLRERHVRIHYFMRKDRYWGSVLSASESLLVEEGLRARGVEIHHFTELSRILGTNGRVSGVETRDGAVIDCDIVAAAIGVLPKKELAEEAGLLCERGVIVDEFLRSSVEDIFAAGDIAEVRDPRTDRRDMEILWNTAVDKGRIAGLNMAGGPIHVYAGGAPLNITRLAGFKLTIMGSVGDGSDSDVQGVVRGDSEAWRQGGGRSMVEIEVGDAHVRLALGESMIEGAVVMGDQSLSFPLQDIIAARADVTAILPRLLEPGAPVGDIINDFWADWSTHSA